MTAFRYRTISYFVQTNRTIKFPQQFFNLFLLFIVIIKKKIINIFYKINDYIFTLNFEYEYSYYKSIYLI